MREFEEQLSQNRIIIADGATGTMLMAAGLPAGTPPELWNVKRPEQILRLHRAYLDAGSQIILTNTFGGSRPKLGRAGFGDRVRELNRAAASLAREAASDCAFVAGDIGPTGEMMAPLGRLTYKEAVEAFAEQAAALAEGGADVIWIETMTDLEEAKAAVAGARQATELPILCSLSFGPRGRTIMGISARQAAEELWPLGLTAIGANCGEGLDVVDEVLRQMSEVLPNAPLIAKPNAGQPKIVNDQTVYDMKPADFAVRMADFITLGARLVGSCCGSNPTHVAALATLVQMTRLNVVAQSRHVADLEFIEEDVGQPLPSSEKEADLAHWASCLPTAIGSLPHQDTTEACKLVLQNFDEIPFWPQLPGRSFKENMYVQYSENLVGVRFEGERVYVDLSHDLTYEAEEFYANFLEEDPHLFAVSEGYAQGLYELLRMKDSLSDIRFMKGQVTGPISFGLQIIDQNRRPILYDDMMRDILVKNLLRKAQWQEEILRRICPNTIIFIDEPSLSLIGSAYVSLPRDQVVDNLEEVFSGLSGLTGVHCCANTDWSLLLETSVDILSFDAYEYLENLALYSQELKAFLDRGGVLAWGIVPADDSKILDETVETLVSRLEDGLKLLEDKGINRGSLLRASLITPSCGTGSLSIDGAEKVLSITKEVSDKVREEYNLAG